MIKRRIILIIFFIDYKIVKRVKEMIEGSLGSHGDEERGMIRKFVIIAVIE